AEGTLRGARHAIASGFRDPEGIYINARPLAAVGHTEMALAMLTRAAQGYWVASAWDRDPAWAPLRDDPRFEALRLQVQTAHEEARRAFVSLGGERLLGLGTGEPTRLLAG